jgi:molecular chaperone DnaK (HSP70)
MEAKVKELEWKLRTLEFAEKRSDEVIKRTVAKRYPCRHENSIIAKVNACHSLKDSIEEEKFVKEESEEQITEWVSDIEEKLKAADEKVLELRQIQDEIVRKTQAIEKAEAMSRTWTSKILLSFTAVDVD